MSVIDLMPTNTSLSVEKIRQDFPVLRQMVQGKPLVYLDNAATTHKPQQVIDAISAFYAHDNSNVHRGVHELSERATQAYEQAREKIKYFLRAKSIQEIVFVRGTTEAINLVAQSYGRSRFIAGDEIIISAMEHHSNIVPWQMLCEQTGAILKIIPINAMGELLLDEYEKLFNPRTKFVALTHVSNALGTLNPIKNMISMAHQFNVPVLIDGAQAIPHYQIDVQDLDCDFYAFSGHKCYGPMGIGVLYGKAELLHAMPPYQGGGDMIRQVSFTKTTYNELPYKFEAGTPNVADAIGLAVALDYMTMLGMENITHYEQSLLQYASAALKDIPDLRIIGNAQHKSGVISFICEKIHAHDVGTILNSYGIAVRSGHHCAMPVMDFFRVPATIRISLAVYNTTAEIDAVVTALQHVREIFK